MSAATTVLNFHRAWTSGDVDRAMTLVADDVVCRAPGETMKGRREYREFLAGFAPMLTGVPEIATLEGEDRVALFYYPQTAGTTDAPAAEYFTLRDGVIVENLTIFDRLSFAPPEAASDE